MRDVKSINSTAEQVNEFIHRHRLSGCPDIYKVVYKYVMSDEAVLEKVDSLIVSDRCTDEAMLVISQEEESKELAELPSIVDTLMASVSDIGKALGVSDKVFCTANSLLMKGSVSPEQLSSITSSLREASQSATDSTKQMEDQLTASLSEIAVLKESLDENRKQMETDFLTQVGNRVYMERIFSTIQSNKASITEGASIVVVDIDNFKILNDTHGHQIGDKVLRYISNHLAKNSEKEDFHVTRFGGEEFVIIFPDRDLPSVYSVVDEIREELSSRVITRKDTQQSLGQLTASFGVAHVSRADLDSDSEDEDPLNLSNMIERADHAMYQAKNTGKNKVVVAPGLTDVKIAFT